MDIRHGRLKTFGKSRCFTLSSLSSQIKFRTYSVYADGLHSQFLPLPFSSETTSARRLRVSQRRDSGCDFFAPTMPSKRRRSCGFRARNFSPFPSHFPPTTQTSRLQRCAVDKNDCETRAGSDNDPFIIDIYGHSFNADLSRVHHLWCGRSIIAGMPSSFMYVLRARLKRCNAVVVRVFIW